MSSAFSCCNHRSTLPVAHVSINGSRVFEENDSRYEKAPTSQTDARFMGQGAEKAGMKASFAIYENQRRWVGLGWTTSLFSHERAAWTDELNDATRCKDEFQLPIPATRHQAQKPGEIDLDNGEPMDDRTRCRHSRTC